MPRWSAMTVLGESVSEPQAHEILIRTQDFLLTTNAHRFAADIYGLLGVELDPAFATPEPRAAELTRLQQEYRCLPLEFLQNYRIARQDGPHGWCSWTGRIETHGYNVGPDPTVAALEHEWQLIAREWPFLNLLCQLYGVSSCWIAETEPVVQFRVERGNVHITTETLLPLPVLHETAEQRQERGEATAVLAAEHRETGISVHSFRDAVQTTRHVLGLSPLEV